MYISPILLGGHITEWSTTGLAENQGLGQNATPRNKKELQAFLGIINYLGKFSPNTVSICDKLQKLTSSRAVWTWNALYQALYDKTKSLIKDEICMIFYDETKSLYHGMDASRIECWHCPVTNQKWYNIPKRYCFGQHHSEANHI